MTKVTFMGAGSTVFAVNILGDCMLSEILYDAEFALYDIDAKRLEDSYMVLQGINERQNAGRAVLKKYLGVENRKEALHGANYIVNAIQVGGYKPSTVIDFEIPAKYGLKQTIADTLGIGGIMRALRTIPVVKAFADDVEEVCPDAWFLNYVNPMGMITGYLQRYTGMKTIGLCHSVQVCTKSLLERMGMEQEGVFDKIAGINHMAWLLEVRDKDGNDLYPEIRRRAAKHEGDRIIGSNGKQHSDIVRLEYVRRLGYYCTESSEHNAEYNPWFIKPNYPELIESVGIPINEYMRRCEEAEKRWQDRKNQMIENSFTHERSREYGARIMESMESNTPYKIGGNVINHGLITNLDAKACVEVPCLVDASGIHPTYIGELPLQLAAMNMTNINVQLLTIEAAVTKKREAVYHAAMLDPHTAAVLSLDDIVKMCDELIEAHGDYLPKFQ
ncbi:MAG: alpha-glucosidase/alpha-galactosidase [Clostridia bacterium]|nr:alpha-glucosidase/alpha-galactosidase [Clostridia bacterium]